MSEKRFTDIWCSETGHIGVTDCGIDKEFTSDEFEDFLNELNDENKTLKKENDDLRTTITKQVEAITEMKDLLYMFADLRIFDYSSEIEEDMQELKKAYDGTLEDFLKYFKED